MTLTTMSPSVAEMYDNVVLMRLNTCPENSGREESYICFVVSRINSPRKCSAARRKEGSFEFVEVGLVSSDSTGVVEEDSI